MPHTIAHEAASEVLIKKSRFVACVQPVTDRTEAQVIVAKLREQHPGATHVCWALLAGGQSAAVDDGEPSGTAGRPMLDVLRHHDLDGVLATVVRYYGGVKLGAGGLVRAYTDCIAQALRNTQTIPIIKNRTVQCVLPYALEGLLRREIEAENGLILETKHGESVKFVFSIAEAAAEKLAAKLKMQSQGKITLKCDN